MDYSDFFQQQSESGQAGEEGPLLPRLPLIEFKRPERGQRTDYDLLAMAQVPQDRDVARSRLIICVWDEDQLDFATAAVPLMKLGSRRGSHSRRTGTALLTDRELFHEIRLVYERRLTNWRRKILSYKTLSSVEIFKFGCGDVGVVKVDDILWKNKFTEMYEHTQKRSLPDSTRWVEWVLDAKEIVARDKVGPCDIYILLIETTDLRRVGIAGIGGLGTVVILTAVWLILKGDPNTVAQVMGFVLTYGGAAAALLAICDQIQEGDKN